jgi:hypothetical protein
MIIERGRRFDTDRDHVGRDSGWLRRKIPAWWLLILAACFITASIGWYLRIRPSAPVWGPISEWVSGVGQLAALIFLAWQVKLLQVDQDRRWHRDDEVASAEREGPARAVVVAVACPGRHRIVCDATNCGRFPVHGVKLAIGRIYDGALRRYGDTKPAGTGGVLLPNARASRTEFDDAWEVDRSEQRVIIEFGDAWGHYWRRVLDLQGAEMEGIIEIPSPTM